MADCVVRRWLFTPSSYDIGMRAVYAVKYETMDWDLHKWAADLGGIEISMQHRLSERSVKQCFSLLMTVNSLASYDVLQFICQGNGSFEGDILREVTTQQGRLTKTGRL